MPAETGRITTIERWDLGDCHLGKPHQGMRIEACGQLCSHRSRLVAQELRELTREAHEIPVFAFLEKQRANDLVAGGQCKAVRIPRWYFGNRETYREGRFLGL